MTPAELERLVALAIAEGAVCVPTGDGGRVLVLPPTLAPGRVANDSDERRVPLAEAADFAATTIGVLRRAIRRGELAAFGGQRDRSVRRGDLLDWLTSRIAKPTKGADSDEIASRVARVVRRRSARRSAR